MQRLGENVQVGGAFDFGQRQGARQRRSAEDDAGVGLEQAAVDAVESDAALARLDAASDGRELVAVQQPVDGSPCLLLKQK